MPDFSWIKYLVDLALHQPILAILALLLAFIVALFRGWVYIGPPTDRYIAEVTKERDLYRSLTDDLTTAFQRSVDVMEAMYTGATGAKAPHVNVRQRRKGDQKVE